MQETPPDARPAVDSGWIVAVAATLGMSVSLFDRQTLAAIGKSVRAGLALDHEHFGWLVSGFALAYLAFAPIAGFVADKLGARRGFALAVVAWSVVSACHSLATSFAALFALRILLGVAEAPSFPAAAQAVRRALPPTKQTAAVGLLFTGGSLGATIATPMAIAVDARYGFRAAFVVTSVCASAWLPFWWLATRGRGLDLPVSAEGRPTSGGTRSILAVARTAPVLRTFAAIVGFAPLLMFVFNWTPQYLVEACTSRSPM